jgi:hypothetical protein
VRAKVVSKDMGARENGAKAKFVLKYSFTHLRTKLQRRSL